MTHRVLLDAEPDRSGGNCEGQSQNWTGRTGKLNPRSSDEPSKLEEPDELYEEPFGGLILPRGTTEFTSSVQRVPLHLHHSKALSFNKESFEPLWRLSNPRGAPLKPSEPLGDTFEGDRTWEEPLRRHSNLEKTLSSPDEASQKDHHKGFFFEGRSGAMKSSSSITEGE